MRVGAFLIAALKTPLWIAAVPTKAKSFVDNPVIGSPRLNRWGLHVARLRAAAALAAMRRRRLARHVSEEHRLAFERDGLVVLPDFLPAADFERLRAEVFDEPWEAHEMRQGSTVTRHVFLDAARLRGSKPVLARLLESPQLLSLIRYVGSTGGQPIPYIQCILASAAGGADDPQCVVHADTFHSTSKAWFFLHDVGPDDGPFLYVPGSHVLSPQRLEWQREQSLSARGHEKRDHAQGSFRISPQDMRRLGLREPQSAAVRANTLIVADTFGFHGRTPSPAATRRVEIYWFMRRNPFTPWTGLDTLSLPFIRSRIGSFVGRLHRLGILPTSFRPVGRVRLEDPPRT